MQFIALGLLITVVSNYWQHDEERYTIHLDEAERGRIAIAYARQFGQPPTTDQMRRLIERHLREEIFLREGLALNLDRDDEIIRRRIVQKYEFLQTDLALAEMPDEKALASWFELNRQRYATSAQVTFSHVYFSVDRDGAEAARQRALAALRTLSVKAVMRAPDLGDAFPGPADFVALSEAEGVRLFGRSELIRELTQLPVGQWRGPYRSGFGWHLVYVTGVVAPTLPNLSDVRERVSADYEDEQRRVRSERAFQALRSRYHIVSAGVRDAPRS